MVEELRVHAAQPTALFGDECSPQPDGRAEIGEVVRRDPRFGQVAREEQISQQSRVGTIGLRASLRATPSPCLGRLGEMGLHASSSQLLDDEAPPGRALERKGGALSSECREERTHLVARRGADHAA